MWSSVIPPLLNSEHTFSGSINVAFDSLVSAVASVGASRFARGCHWQPAPLERAVLLFGHLLAIGFQISPELSIFFHTASLSAAQKLFHQIILWRTVKFGRAVLFHNIENLIPEQICLFLK